MTVFDIITTLQSKVEPLSILASVIALCQAGDRILTLISRIRCVLHASDEIRALQQDIERLKLVLQALADVPQICQAPAQGGLRVIVENCENVPLQARGHPSGMLETDNFRSLYI